MSKKLSDVNEALVFGSFIIDIYQALAQGVHWLLTPLLACISILAYFLALPWLHQRRCFFCQSSLPLEELTIDDSLRFVCRTCQPNRALARP